MKRILSALMCLTILFSLLPCITVQAGEPEEKMAENICSYEAITDYSGFKSLVHLFDGKEHWGSPSSANCSLTLENKEGIASLYIIFYKDQKYYTVTDNATGTVYTREDPFLHDYLDLEAAFGSIPTSVTVTFGPDDLIINELYAFTEGKLPDWVQRWEKPNDGDTDLLLFSAHGDDEHLFFAGVLPYYAGELGYQVQVVYLTDHHNNVGPTRIREILDGLWAAGTTTYPVFGSYDDFYRWGIDAAYEAFDAQGVSRDDLIGFVVEQLRRFKPKVVIGHDFKGEYNNGQHMVYADVVAAAVEISINSLQYPKSAKTYGVWNVPKAYFHLYAENPIIIDWDQPLEHFDGKTAWQISSRYALQKHESQLEALKTGTTWYFGDYYKAAYISWYTPCKYGLYRSTVGEDVEKNDFFENVTTHQQDAELAEAQRLAEEEAQRKAEEEARLKAEEEARKASEEAARQESAPEEPTAPQPTQSAADSDPTPSLLVRFWYVPAVVALLLMIGLIGLLIRRKK